LVPRRKIRNGPITVAGLIQSSIGLGESSRLFLSAFREIGCATTFANLGHAFYWHNDFPLPVGEPATFGEGGTLLINMNPIELALSIPTLWKMGLIRHKRIVGCWAWELETIPRDWLVGFKLVDEIWAPSQFVADAIKPYTTLPVRIVHYPVREPVVGNYDRVHFGLPKNAFVVLNVFNMRSSVERKNPIGAIRAFKEAFGCQADALLLVKMLNAAEFLEERLKLETEVKGHDNIRLVYDSFDPARQGALLNCADVVMSLHRSEGFGLVLAEAMRLGKPVIATGYSGNLDFMTADNSILIGYKMIPVRCSQRIYKVESLIEPARWADPDIYEAAQWLRKLRNDRSLCRTIGDQAKQASEQLFGLSQFRRSVIYLDQPTVSES